MPICPFLSSLSNTLTSLDVVNGLSWLLHPSVTVDIMASQDSFVSQSSTVATADLSQDTLDFPTPSYHCCQRLFNKCVKLAPLDDAFPGLPSDPGQWFPADSVTSTFSPLFSQWREELNQTKGLLNHHDLQKWHEHTKLRNPAGRVLYKVKEVSHPELLTQAWCKFTEILHRFELLPPSEGEKKHVFTSTHLCSSFSTPL